MHPRNDEFSRLLKGSGWGDARAARELGLHPTVIWKYRQGVTTPSLTVLRLLAGLSSQQITLGGEAPVRFNDAPRVLDPWEEKIVVALRRLEIEPRKRVVEAFAEMIDAITRPVRYPKSNLPEPVDPLPTTEQLIEAAAAAVTGKPRISPSSEAAARSGEALRQSDAGAGLPSVSPRRRARKPGR